MSCRVPAKLQSAITINARARADSPPSGWLDRRPVVVGYIKQYNGLPAGLPKSARLEPTISFTLATLVLLSQHLLKPVIVKVSPWLGSSSSQSFGLLAGELVGRVRVLPAICPAKPTGLVICRLARTLSAARSTGKQAADIWQPARRKLALLLDSIAVIASPLNWLPWNNNNSNYACSDKLTASPERRHDVNDDNDDYDTQGDLTNFSQAFSSLSVAVALVAGQMQAK